METTPNKVIIVNTKSNLLAFILSFFIPGLGQIYLGYPVIGTLSFFIAMPLWFVFFWFPFVPALFHLIIMIDAAFRKVKERGS